MSTEVDGLHRRDPEINRSRDLAESLAETVREPLLVLDGTLRVRRANRAFYRNFGMAPSDTEGRPIDEAGGGRWDVPRLRALLEEVLSGTRCLEDFAIEHDFPGIGARSLLLNVHRVDRGEGDGAPQIIVAIEDVTLRKRAERQCQETLDRLRAVLDTSVDAIVTIDAHGMIGTVNAAAERMFGYRADELIGQNLGVIVPAPFREWRDSGDGRCMETREKRVISIGREVEGLRKDGSTFPVDVVLGAYEDRGQPVFTGILRDLSALRALEQEVLEAATLEQQRIGQELHDTSAQELAALGLLADSLVEGLKSESSVLVGIAGKMADGLKRVLGQIRAFARGLIRVELDSDRLVVALADLASQTTALHGVSCTLECRGQVDLANNQTATQLYSIARESVTNALKHAQASQLSIVLEGDDQSVILRVEDDGVGLAQTRFDDRGLGLKIMRYRAGLMNAQLAIASGQSGGTVVTCVCLKKDLPHDPV
jgi:PAS domain S-box-containing protein